ncbi:MAG: 2-amino-4-hydroxy-6-hydroxymethyldihydropteridine diphosphokinase [bacterium]
MRNAECGAQNIRAVERIFLSLGSNLGDRLKFLRTALAALRDNPGIEVVKTSTVYESDAMYMDEETPPFLDAAVEIRTNLEPLGLLDVIQQIEISLGRERGPRMRYESRVIDIDIMLWGDRKISSSRLVIPHPGLKYRRFFLQPLADLDPDLPILDTGLTVAERAARLAQRQSLMPVATAEEWVG